MESGGGGGGKGEGGPRRRPRGGRGRNKGGGANGGANGGGSGNGHGGANGAAPVEANGDTISALPAPPAAPPAPGPAAAKANPNSRTSSTTRAHLTGNSFASLDIHPLTKKAIAEVLCYEVMSVVQAQTLPVILSGFDVIAKAKTGTGKTIAFLLPTIEVLLKPATGGGVRALAISPTRELASQIRDEAEQLITFHKPALTTAVVVGGTNIKSDVRMLQTKPPSLLVATPGRLNDLLYNYGADQACAGLMALIFDEADQLLEMGFRPDIQKILQALAPSRERRMTLLFSATLPKDVLSVAQIATRGPDRTKLVDTVGEETNTNAQVEQASTVTSLGGQAPELFALVQEATAEPGYKVVVFFTTARLTQLYSELFGASGVSVLEMHSRKSQPHRTRIADQFRDGTDLIMFSSDVSARGMDYPDVTAVIQVGMPSDRAQYIHRLGRAVNSVCSHLKL